MKISTDHAVLSCISERNIFSPTAEFDIPRLSKKPTNDQSSHQTRHRSGIQAQRRQGQLAYKMGYCTYSSLVVLFTSIRKEMKSLKFFQRDNKRKIFSITHQPTYKATRSNEESFLSEHVSQRLRSIQNLRYGPQLDI
jgi:hypothetical protein